ncbi:unnamed protein product [Rotaria sp. Silwood2]|nr:unnamed protein product [Rotaria sp. Silwood2]CAF2597322.1 unnamed protein product [Rotaria sp. Silwood2]CAF3004334.1 unnamed protein product [Rotaria sp. Silwood2]CAF3939092.1 unnamed protein product [Rotaria sp. Silwood2]CAF4036599.1 unnamed protein product [Rotaria sp. Silwood2]
MAKKTKDKATATKKAPKVKGPVDPVKTKNLVRLLDILALLLAIAAFLLQLFAVISYHWKWQKTDLHSIVLPDLHDHQAKVYEDSQLHQNYGLFSREVKVYGNNDEQVDILASTRFPRLDEGDEHLDYCLSQTSTLRGALLTCSKQLISRYECHCRRHSYWNWVIFFEIFALILLGIVVFLTALLTGKLPAIVKLAAAGLAVLAFLVLFLGLILILSYLKRETHSFADAYPYIFQRLANVLGYGHNSQPLIRRSPTVLHQAIRRQTKDTYRAYSLGPKQYPHNLTHYQEFSAEIHNWVYKPYPGFVQTLTHETSPQGRAPYTTNLKPEVASETAHTEHRRVLGYDRLFENTEAGIGWSTVLSILAMILSLLLPLILIFSWLTGKKLPPITKTTETTTTIVKTDYAVVPQHEAAAETVPLRPIPTDYDPYRPIGEAIVTRQNVGQGPYDTHGVRPEPTIIRDVVIRDNPPVSGVPQEHVFPVRVETTQTTQRT